VKKITMSTQTHHTYQPRVIERSHLQALFDALARRGHRLLGPTVRNGGIVYDDIQRVEDLPLGWTDHQEGGTYRLTHTGTAAVFGYVVGQGSWKKYLHLPTATLWEAERSAEGFRTAPAAEPPPRRAFIGVRPCELAAIAIQDKVFTAGPYADPLYRRQRENLFLVAVNCTRPGGTCFCGSMGTGPEARSGYDIVLTELSANGRHVFIAEAGTVEGEAVLAELAAPPAGESDRQEAARATADAAHHMGRQLDTDGLKARMEKAVEHPHWAEIAARCLTCGNCTMVCPTCFCTTVEDWTALGGEKAQRVRKWDSCFTVDFSYIFGGSIRPSPYSRYRQWMTHKLASWVDQFGTFGCVGCGRCITWCPVGIDITEEARVFAHSLQRAEAHT